MKGKLRRSMLLMAVMTVVLTGCGGYLREEGMILDDNVAVEDADTNGDTGSYEEADPGREQQEESIPIISLEDVPEFSDQPYVMINDGEPFFIPEEMTTESYEFYSELDELGRCQTAEACVGTDIMPTEERGQIGSVKPTGWHTVKYDIVNGKYLYNRCHLLGFQLTGENANRKNLITGTRYLNVDGMLPFENMVADYVKETENHVMYRVTPIYKEDNLVASGVLMEGKSVEDDGESVSFCVYAYNNQPGIQIDYATGDSQLIQ